MVAVAAVVFAVLSLVGDVLPDDVRWAVLFAGVGLLVYRITIPDGRESGLDAFLGDRASFEDKPTTERIRGARELWIYAPSAVNFLSAANCDLLRRAVLSRTDGVVRIVVLDPERQDALAIAARQIDDSVDFKVQRLDTSLGEVIGRLSLMAGLPLAGSLEYRLLDYNPGFSMIAFDPGAKHGSVIVEMHGFHNESTSGRMHLELTRADSERWYAYWIDQFDHIWAAARPPKTGTDPSGAEPPA